MSDSPERMHALLLAIEAGAEAEELTAALVQDRRAGAFSVGLIARLVLQIFRPPGTTTGPVQARRACDCLDEFSAQLIQVKKWVEDPLLDGAIARAPAWSAAVWESDDNAGAVYNDARTVGALLNQYRVNAVLGRPAVAPPST